MRLACFLVAIFNDNEYVRRATADGKASVRPEEHSARGGSELRVRLQTDRCVVKKLDMGRMKGKRGGRRAEGCDCDRVKRRNGFGHKMQAAAGRPGC